MFEKFLEVLYRFIRLISSMFGSNASSLPLSDKPKLNVFVKSNAGEQVNVQLDPAWTVRQLKADIAPKFKSSPENLRIIFAGKELPDDLVINRCDLGNHSVLHAVKIITNKNTTVASGSIVKENQATSITSTSKPEETNINLSSTRGENTFDALDKSVEVSSKSYPPDLKHLSKPLENLSVNEDICSRSNRLLCDASTVLTIQLTEEEQRLINELKAQDGEGEAPHFYVYCVKPCSWVRVGKLRVRCSKCKEGALIVDRDPTSWVDVLNPSQITASCETPGCGKTDAEFFFKCRDHETTGVDDTAVPLYLVRANLPKVPCLACTDVSSPIIVFQCESAHVMCLDCFVTYCISRLGERQFVHDHKLGYTLPCPAGCPNSLIKEVHHFKLMGDQHYSRYQRWGTEEAVLAAGGVLCPYPGCGQGILPDPDCRRIACVGGGCGYVFCRDCLQGFHIGDCDPGPEFNTTAEGEGGFVVDPERAARSKFDEASSVTIRAMTKPCPKCRTPTERSGGCMHMVCTRGNCSFHWCWVCQTEWTRECMGAHWFG